MNGSYRSDNELHDLDESVERDQEISLGTSTVLGIFFALALVCALFFGFGYAMGRRSSQVVVAPTETAPATISEGSKPLPGSPAGSQSAKNGASNDSPVETAPATSSAGAGGSDQPSPVASGTSTVVTEPQPTVPSIAVPAKLPVKTSPPPAAAGPTTSGSLFVQIAAVSHREDADILVSTLTRRGYDVAIHQEPQDKLMHVQIGPFANKKDAEAMKQRLLADGYNAIVK
jgi:DedD protein